MQNKTTLNLSKPATLSANATTLFERQLITAGPNEEVVKDALRYVFPTNKLQGVQSTVFETLAQASVGSKAVTRFMNEFPGAFKRITVGSLTLPGTKPQDFMTFTRNKALNGQPVLWKDIEPRMQVLIRELATAMKLHPRLTLMEEGSQKRLEAIDSLTDKFRAAGYTLEEATARAVVADVNTRWAAHGGDAELSKYDNGVVSVKLRGSCETCPNTSSSIQDGLKVLLQGLMQSRFKELVVLNPVKARPA